MISDGEMHKIKCSECGKETTVSFRPDTTRPVFCKECYQNHRPCRASNRLIRT